MFGDIPSNNNNGLSADNINPETGVPLPPSVKVYKPEIHGRIMNSLSAVGKENKNLSVIERASDAACAAGEPASDDTAQTDPLQPEYEPKTELSEEPDVSEITTSEPEPPIPEMPVEIEEPIPALFEGIGRTSWNESPAPEESAPEVPLYYIYEDDFESEPEDESEHLEETEEEVPEDEPEDDGIDVFELLDFIDDIEFSGMDPEPLRAVQYASEKNDPYNTAFNEPVESQGEPDEFSVAPAFEFEKK